MNAYRMTDPPPDGGGVDAGDGAWRSRTSGLGARRTIDYVSAHGTARPGNDKTETVAIKQVFGDHAYKLAISSVKSMTGHLTCGGRGAELLASLRAMTDGVVPPTINLEHPDPKLRPRLRAQRGARAPRCAPRWSTPSRSAARTAASSSRSAAPDGGLGTATGRPLDRDARARAGQGGDGDPQRAEHAGDLRQPLPALQEPARRADPRHHGRARAAHLLERADGAALAARPAPARSASATSSSPATRWRSPWS